MAMFPEYALWSVYESARASYCKPGVPYTAYLGARGRYEMACGHCRRPRKEISAFNFDQLYWIRGFSSSPKSQGVPKVVLRGSKMAPEIASWDPENSPGRPEAHPGRALALPAPRKAPGSVRAAADCTSPGGHPGGAGDRSVRQPTSPQALFLLLLLGALFLHDPTRSTGSADTRWPAATAADPEKKSWPSTSINFAGSEACRALRRAKVGRK